MAKSIDEKTKRWSEAIIQNAIALKTKSGWQYERWLEGMEKWLRKEKRRLRRKRKKK